MTVFEKMLEKGIDKLHDISYNIVSEGDIYIPLTDYLRRVSL